MKTKRKLQLDFQRLIKIVNSYDVGFTLSYNELLEKARIDRWLSREHNGINLLIDSEYLQKTTDIIGSCDVKIMKKIPKKLSRRVLYYRTYKESDIAKLLRLFKEAENENSME